MIFKIHQEQPFTKIFYFQKQKLINGQVLKQLYLQDIPKVEFDKNPVLNRFDHQLKTSGLHTSHTLKPDFSWACINIDNIKK